MNITYQTKTLLIVTLFCSLFVLAACDNSENTEVDIDKKLEMYKEKRLQMDNAVKSEHMVKLNFKEIKVSDEQFSELMKLESIKSTNYNSCDEHRDFIIKFFSSMGNVVFDNQNFDLKLISKNGKEKNEVRVSFLLKDDAPNCSVSLARSIK